MSLDSRNKLCFSQKIKHEYFLTTVLRGSNFYSRVSLQFNFAKVDEISRITFLHSLILDISEFKFQYSIEIYIDLRIKRHRCLIIRPVLTFTAIVLFIQVISPVLRLCCGIVHWFNMFVNHAEHSQHPPLNLLRIITVSVGVQKESLSAPYC